MTKSSSKPNEYCFADGLAWKDITYDIPQKKKKKSPKDISSEDIEKNPPSTQIADDGTKRILRGVSGKVSQGEYVVLLGASGAGKTTLLNILSARISKTGNLGGVITYGGVNRDPESWKRTVGYVEQDDVVLPRLTVKETITTAAKLRLPNQEFSKEDKRQRVEETIEMLRLESCQDSQVGGNSERGISGGERIRLSIAVELVSDVSLLFLDEPTSGLDAFAANLLVHNVSNIVKERHLACLMTVHQPSWAIFTKLDRVILLAAGAIYYDGSPKDTIPYFESIGFTVPEGTNPADYFITIAENQERNQEGEKRIQMLLNKWRDRGERETLSQKEALASGTTLVKKNSENEAMKVDDEKVANGMAKRTMTSKTKSQWPTPWWEEFGLLFQRWWRELIRDKQTLFGSIGQTALLLIVIVLFPLITPFAVQRKLMFRERSAGLYRTSSFYLAKVLLEIPSALIQRIIYYTVLYFMVGLRLSASHFFIFLGINMLHLINSVCLGLAIGAVSPSIDIANIIAPFINVLFLLYGGTFLPNPPPWFVWLKWISPINYTFSALAQNEFRGRSIACDGDGGGSTGTACYGNGDNVIEAYNVGRFSIAQDVGFLLAISFVFFLLGYIGLRWSGKPRLRFL